MFWVIGSVVLVAPPPAASPPATAAAAAVAVEAVAAAAGAMAVGAALPRGVASCRGIVVSAPAIIAEAKADSRLAT